MFRFLKFLGLIGLYLAVGIMSGIITMTILLGRREVVVPDLKGKDLVMALDLVSKNGLKLKVTHRDYDPLIPKDCIISQDPEANSKIKKDRTIKVVLSLGRGEIIVPDLKGENFRRAEIILRQNGLKIGKIVRVHSPYYPADTVITQNPEPLTKVSRNEAIGLLLSEGSPLNIYLMPDLSNKYLGEAKEIIEQAGLTLGQIEYEESAGSIPNTVIRQSPPYGFQINQGEEVNLVISKGIGSTDNNNGTKSEIYTLFRYTLPPQSGPKTVKIVSLSEKGYRELWNQLTLPGEEIRLLLNLTGKTTIQVYLDDILVEEKTY
jgi:serine/threonine-protein kinase